MRAGTEGDRRVTPDEESGRDGTVTPRNGPWWKCGWEQAGLVSQGWNDKKIVKGSRKFVAL